MKPALAFALIFAAPAWAEDPAQPRFQDETATAGLATPYLGDWQYMVGGGVAVLDCNGDGAQDLFLAGGEGPSGLYRNTGDAGGALDFTAVPDSGAEVAAVTGAWPLDVNSDGHMDLALMRVGENLLLRGDGTCLFTPANEAWGFDGGDGWSTAFAATWETGANWPTLAEGNYIDRREESFPWGSCTPNMLHRPAASGTGFAPPLPLDPSFCALSMIFSDWNASGRRDLRLSNDREYYKGGQEQLWHLAPGEDPRPYTETEGWKRLRLWGMGIATRDLDADGFNEFYLTSMADNKLQALAAPGQGALPQYADQALKRGITAHRPYQGEDLRPSTAWHAQFEDVNNDGRADLFVAKGNVDRMPDFANADPNNLFLQRADGTFLESGGTSGVDSTGTARGAALADFNRDGWLDLVVVNRRTGAEIWRNLGSGGTGHWLAIDLAQTGPNPDAVGAWIELRAGGHLQRREIAVGGGHASGQTGPWHFGLGAETSAEIRVIWPDGTEGGWTPVPAVDRVLTVTR